MNNNTFVRADMVSGTAYLVYAEEWYQRAWRPMMAAVYMALCILDYGIRPAINYYHMQRVDYTELVATIQPLDPVVQVQIINSSKDEAMKPILNEIVHLAFGAILGVAAYTRTAGKNNFAPPPAPSINNVDKVVIQSKGVDNPG